MGVKSIHDEKIEEVPERVTGGNEDTETVLN
jgi:hypothetical protein